MSKFHLSRQFAQDQVGFRDVLLVLCAGMQFDEIAFDEEIQREIDRNLAPDAIIILTRQTQVSTIASAAAESKVKSLFARLPTETAVCIVAFDENGKETARQRLFGANEYLHPIEWMKFPVMTEIFRRRQALVEAGTSYHFRNPSGRHTDRFMRIANVMASQAEISFYAYALLSHIPAETINIYVDTPALYPLISAINDHYKALGSRRHLEVDSFGSYEGLKDYQFSEISRSIVLISASSSGSLSESVRNKIGFGGIMPILNLVYLGDGNFSGIIICDLRKNSKNPDGFEFRPQNNTDGACLMCSSGSVAIHLRGDRFELTGPPPHPVMITLPDAPGGLLALMGRLVGLKSLQIGLAESGVENRQYYVNFPKLLESDQYKDNLRQHVVSSFPQSATCIVCVDAISLEFAKAILHLSGKDAAKIPILMREDLTEEIDASDNCHVVVAANVVESGRGLLEVSRDLRLSYPKAPQTYYIGFAKLESPDKLKTLKSTLTKTSGVLAHGFFALEEMILPSSIGENAWARERQLLQSTEALKKVKFTPEEQIAFRERRDILERGSVTITDDIFLPTEMGESLRLQSGFVFWPEAATSDINKTQADIYFTISSVLQSLRAKGIDTKVKSLRNDFFLHNVIDPAVFGRFNDGVIQASFLRACMPHELDYTDAPMESREAARIVRRVLTGASNAAGTAALEFLLAIASERLRLRMSDLGSCLEGLSSKRPLMSSLIKLAKHRLP